MYLAIRIPSTRVPPHTPLPQCPYWPTSHTLPRVAVERLDLAVWRLNLAGRPARRRDVLGIVIVLCGPQDAMKLRAILMKPHRSLAGTVSGLPPGKFQTLIAEHNQHLMVRLPSPVTLRLNALVAAQHGLGFETSRRQIVTALLMHALPRTQTALVSAFERYYIAPARAAAIPGRPATEVLSLVHPRAGRRPKT
jgi:hypothetical protein